MRRYAHCWPKVGKCVQNLKPLERWNQTFTIDATTVWALVNWEEIQASRI